MLKKLILVFGSMNSIKVYCLQISTQLQIALILFPFPPSQSIMQPPQNNKTISSLNSSRLSQSSNTVPNNQQVKRMEAKLLMDYFYQNQQLKQRKYMGENYDKANYGNYEQALTQNYKSQQQAKKRRKQEIKQTLAEEYEEMIRFKEQKQREQRQKTLQMERKNLQISPWGRDSKKDVVKSKKMQQQYGKQLQMHIRLQEIQKYEQRLKQRQAIEKYQRQQQQLNLNYDRSQLHQFRRKQEFEKRQNEILGVSQVNPEAVQFDSNRSTELKNNDFRALKRKEQMLYGTGLQQQLRSQTISPKMNDRSINYPDQTNRSTQRQFPSDNMFRSEVYNPITNPIQINYKNPYVLRMLAQHNG